MTLSISVRLLGHMVGSFENAISVYCLLCNREFTFCKGLTCFATSFISYPEDGTIDLRQILDPKIWK